MAETPVKTPAEARASLPPARPRDFFGGLRGEIDRVFEEFDRSFWGMPTRWRAPETSFFRRALSSSAWSPSVDIGEKDGMFEVTADLPGLDEKNIDVKLSDGILTVKGTREESKEEKKKGYYVSERQFGSFERTFQVPESVDADKIDAHFKNGVLTISLPKKPEALKAEKKISIKAS
ncbi:MAG: Hsp20/alpha crystallin family protein [Rhodomicrobium sp.]